MSTSLTEILKDGSIHGDEETTASSKSSAWLLMIKKLELNLYKVGSIEAKLTAV